MTSEETIRSYLSLGKVKISSFATLSAVVGFHLAGPQTRTTLPALTAGVFLMACGACALNQYQERDSDALMARTAGRPIPAGKIKPLNALCFSLILIALGFLMLFLTGSSAAPILGFGAVLWYNGFYTWIKSRTAFAAFPGALAGVIPPAIGWAAGGGSPGDPALAFLCLFFFMWQMPHIFVHRLTFADEYEAISQPSLTAVFTEGQLGRLVFQWLFASAVSLQMIIVHGLVRSPAIRIALLGASLWLAVQAIPLLRKGRPSCPSVFRRINYVVLAVMLLLFLD